MKRYIHLPIVIVFTMHLMSCAAANSADVCYPQSGVALQILGSGGPIADDARASSAYLIWVDGKSRVLIDTGGGSFLRFGESGARFEDVEFIGLSHYHADHSADFAAILKSGYFSNRRDEISVAGPSGSSRFPGLQVFLDSQLDREIGAYAYLGGYLDGTGGVPTLVPVEVSTSQAHVVPVFRSDDGDVAIDALPVPHGIVPAVAFRVQANKKTVVFTSDQNGTLDKLSTFAEGADALVVHLPIPEGAGPGIRSLHAVPSEVAALGNKARPEKLILSHFMGRSLSDPSVGVGVVRDQYDGDVIAATDLMCVPLD